MRKLTIRGCVAGLAALLALAGGAHAAATVGTFESQDTYSFPEDDSATCLGPGATGTLTATETVTGRFTSNTYGYHWRATSTADVRVDYADGRYLLGTLIDRYGANATTKLETATNVQSADGTLYAPDGQALGTIAVHGDFHHTWRDTNGNGEPDPGELTADFQHFRLRCP